jgi:hypothetical protein
LSKNTRWALAIVGAVIIVIAAVVVGTGKDDTDATPTGSHGSHESGATAPTPQAPTGGGSSQEAGQGTGSSGGQESGGAAPGNESGGAAPGNESGGAAPGNETGGAQAQTGVISPILTPGKPKKITVDKGETVVIRARSPKAATLHVHGYNEMIELKAGQTGRIKFVAKFDGEFSIEFHFAGSESPAGTLTVNP